MSLAPSRDETPTGGSTYDLFVSYADADRDWVEGYLFDALDAAGIRYVSEAAFELGAPRVAEFERAVRASRRTLLVITPAYLADAYAPFGDLLAQSFGVETGTWPVIPLTLEDATLPPRLAMLVALDATSPSSWDTAVGRLCAAIDRPVPGATRVPCPYPGMVPFREADAARFFGRDAEIAEMVERLRLHQFLAVIGPSGTGKSSLVLAGLIPALRSSGLFGAGAWDTVVFRPGAAPADALQLALAGVDDSARRLLVCDQFEETFTIGRQQAVPFQEHLAGLAEVDRCWVVVTVRADFYADLMSSPLWDEIRAHRVELAPLGDSGMRAAIVRPAEAEGVHVDPALVERLVADSVGEPGALPLVQDALVLSWERLARRYLPLEAYTSAAGRSGLQAAMATRADAALARLSPEQQAIARRVFVRLVQFGEGRADTRRQQRVSELRSAGDAAADVEETVAHLVDDRLLTSSGGEDGGDRRIDLAHEALIAGWPTLQGWLAERRTAEQTRRRLDDKAAEWVRLGRGQGGLLDEVELAETERWLASPDAADVGFDPALGAPPACAGGRRSAGGRAPRRHRARHLGCSQHPFGAAPGATGARGDGDGGAAAHRGGGAARRGGAAGPRGPLTPARRRRRHPARPRARPRDAARRPGLPHPTHAPGAQRALGGGRAQSPRDPVRGRWRAGICRSRRHLQRRRPARSGGRRWLPAPVARKFRRASRKARAGRPRSELPEDCVQP